MSDKFQMMARRGIALPEMTRNQIRKTGIFCRPAVAMVYQKSTHQWYLRGEESGGAVSDLGHYVSFVGKNGAALTWLQRIQNFMPNGLHAVVIERELMRIEMFRYQHTYDLLMTRHWLSGEANRRPTLESQVEFFGRFGTLSTELWGKDAEFRGGAAPRFYRRNGEEQLPQERLLDAVLKITEAVCCIGCRHSHLLEVGATTSAEAVLT